jgi:hypothetical protein
MPRSQPVGMAANRPLWSSLSAPQIVGASVGDSVGWLIGASRIDDLTAGQNRALTLGYTPIPPAGMNTVMGTQVCEKSCRRDRVRTWRKGIGKP